LVLPIALVTQAVVQLFTGVAFIYCGFQDTCCDGEVLNAVTLLATAVYALAALLMDEVSNPWTDSAAQSYAWASCSGIVAAVCVSLQIAVQLRDENIVMRSSYLRWRHDGSLVRLADIPGSFKYHLFLSHVWGSGNQEKMRFVKEHLGLLLKNARVFLDVVRVSSARHPLPPDSS
jgi:hypothetical protein